MFTKLAFAFWFLALSIPFSMMMGSHTLSLKPSNAKELVALKGQKTWTILHFLNPDCGCSERVFKSLVERKPKTQNVEEKVFVLGKKEQWVKALKEKGFTVVSDSMDHYSEKYKINAVPQLVIMDQSKAVKYAGGYSSKRGPASVVEDEKIFHELTKTKKTNERPIYGCVNGSDNQKKVDLVGYKYKREQ